MSSISEEEILENNENNEVFEDRIEEENTQQIQETQEKSKPAEKEKQIKPHEKITLDYTKGILPSQEETGDQAPLVIVVQGSKNSGKSTLIKSLVKYYTRQKISKVAGTITIRSSKNQRLTFIECPNDINSMIDYAKIADLALLLVDGSLGFEMETFEFLSILKSHGFPNVMGVLTHLDFFKENKQLRKTKKKLKKRFTYETGEEYKLFYLSGLKNELYPQLEILNLARFISIIKYKQINWKANHPFILIDRFEDNEPQAKKDEDDCSLSFYGYVRGASLRDNKNIHIVGLGDYPTNSIEIVEDPCPPLQKKFSQKVVINEENENEEENEKEKAKPKKKRTLKQNEKLIYAPFADLNALNFDKSGGYITIPEEHIVFTKIEKPSKREELLNIFEKENDEENDESDKNEEEVEEGVKMVREMHVLDKNINDNLKTNEDVDLFENFALETPKDQQTFEEKNLINFKERKNLLTTLKNKTSSLEKVDFESNFVELNQNIFSDDISQLIYENANLKKWNNFDCSKFENSALQDKQHYIDLKLKSFFVTGENLLEEEIEEEENKKKGKKFDLKEKEKAEEEALMAKTKKDLEKHENEEFFEKSLGLYKKGLYVKITVSSIKYKNYKNFSGETPLVFTRINPAEDNFGFLKMRIKKHRWYGNILKSNDPLIFSVGWRRYQSLPIYCVQDPNDRYRFLKYTPSYDFCFAYTYGCFVPPLTGVLCVQTLNNQLAKFRIAALGQVLELSASCEIMKKLKLIGEPFKIYKNTAFIKGMFNSLLEVSKFEGATIRSVSGIRGQIKKALTVGPDGSFRATFEDKILMSDIIFCRTWYSISPEKFFNPIVLFDKLRLMKNTWELRQANKIAIPKNEDSEYKPIERQPKIFNPLKISKKLEENLPFKSKEKNRKISLKEKLEREEYAKPLKQLTNDHEKQVYSLIQRLNTIKNEKKKMKQEKKKESEKIRSRIKESEEKKANDMKKDFMKEKYKKKGRKEK